MTAKQRKHSAVFKMKVACEALLQHRTLAEISGKYGIHPTQIRHWKQQLAEKMDDIFEGPKTPQEIKRQAQLIEDLYKQIGQQKVECDWLKKKVDQLPS